MKVTVKLAHEIDNALQKVVGYIDLALDDVAERSAAALVLRKAKAAALALAKVVHDQTVKTVDNSEARDEPATLETKREKK